MAITYKFSGHESFPCKSLWLKKGYDFVVGGNDLDMSRSPASHFGLRRDMILWLEVTTSIVLML